MEIRYDFGKVFEFSDICKIINYYFNAGFESDFYYFDSDEERLYCNMILDSKEILIDDYCIKFRNFNAEEALKHYKIIESMMSNNEC